LDGARARLDAAAGRDGVTSGDADSASG
jgi:hypothetical protein